MQAFLHFTAFSANFTSDATRADRARVWVVRAVTVAYTEIHIWVQWPRQYERPSTQQHTQTYDIQVRWPKQRIRAQRPTEG